MLKILIEFVYKYIHAELKRPGKQNKLASTSFSRFFNEAPVLVDFSTFSESYTQRPLLW